MDKKLKTLIILNCISYIVMIFISYAILTNLFMSLDNKIKFILGNLPLFLIAITSFILTSDRFKEFKNIKKEAILDWSIRIIAFVIIINCSNHFPSIKLLFIFIIACFLINTIIEYRIINKLMKIKKTVVTKEKQEISYEEKCNLKFMPKAINKSMFATILFIALSLSVPINKNMEGTSMGYISVIISILVYIWFLRTLYINYTNFYLDKIYAKNLSIQNISVVSIGYLICLISSFINLRHELYGYITLMGILFTLTSINTIRKMSLYFKFIKDNLDEDTYIYFLTREDI